MGKCIYVLCPPTPRRITHRSFGYMHHNNAWATGSTPYIFHAGPVLYILIFVCGPYCTCGLGNGQGTHCIWILFCANFAWGGGGSNTQYTWTLLWTLFWTEFTCRLCNRHPLGLFLHTFATVLTHWQTILACLIVIWNNISVVILVFSFPDLPGKMTKTLNAMIIILVHVNIHVMYTRIQMKYIRYILIYKVQQHGLWILWLL